MAQYKAGSVNVTQLSDEIEGIGTAWLSNVNVGDLFIVQGVQDTYYVSIVTDDTHITLDRTYFGESIQNISYVISKSFTPTRRYPYPEKADLEVGAIMERALNMLDADTQQSFYILDEDVDAIYLVPADIT